MRKFWIMAATVALLGFGAAVVSAQGGSSATDDLDHDRGDDHNADDADHGRQAREEAP